MKILRSINHAQSINQPETLKVRKQKTYVATKLFHNLLWQVSIFLPLKNSVTSGYM